MAGGFRNRVVELGDIARILDSEKFEFLVVFGRRRVGKTALILKAIEHKKHVYFLSEVIENMPRFISTCAHVLPDITKTKPDFHTLIEYMKDKLDVLVIDEFQYLVGEYPSVPTVFQAVIDGQLKDSRLKLVIIGSSVSMMNTHVLSSLSPLYGRKTAALKLGPVSFTELLAFFPGSSITELLEVYAFSGGIPYYMNMIDASKGFWPWLDDELHRPTCLFDQEIDFLMRYEFTKPDTYMRIVDAVATGCTRMNDIATRLNLKTTDLTVYINNLLSVDFITKEIPITDGPRSRNGRYFVKDRFMAFWYRCILPNKSALEQRILGASTIKPRFDMFLGAVFEDAVRQYLIAARPFPFTMIGRWWWKDNEIDLVAYDEPSATMTCVECEWSDNVRPVDLLQPLLAKIALVPLKRQSERIFLFARSFASAVTSFSGHDVRCVDAAEMEKTIQKFQK
ncbi:MAG: ATP-binding protein [Candidatus Lokiarchaeota archaeon]|nr:ATP-binding protein [Candidatus Lokiarchaeota archaeon]